MKEVLDTFLNKKERNTIPELEMSNQDKNRISQIKDEILKLENEKAQIRESYNNKRKDFALKNFEGKYLYIPHYEYMKIGTRHMTSNFTIAYIEKITDAFSDHFMATGKQIVIEYSDRYADPMHAHKTVRISSYDSITEHFSYNDCEIISKEDAINYITKAQEYALTISNLFQEG